MNYALVIEGVVTNIIWLHPMNESEFPEAVPMGDYPVRIGDTYDGKNWYREGIRVKTNDEMLAEEQEDMLLALEMLGVTPDE